jgi:hypothetical protein
VCARTIALTYYYADEHGDELCAMNLSALRHVAYVCHAYFLHLEAQSSYSTNADEPALMATVVHHSTPPLTASSTPVAIDAPPLTMQQARFFRVCVCARHMGSACVCLAVAVNHLSGH